MDKQILAEKISEQFNSLIDKLEVKDMVTVELPAEQLLTVCRALRDQEPFKFELLLDICGVDNLDYGLSQWRTDETTTSGFSRGCRPFQEDVIKQIAEKTTDIPRFVVVYHLLSLTHNHRLRLKVYRHPEPIVPSVIDVWASANWYEREAFDLFGIIFDGHPDLRRLLTDYGFIGHPFRKDFPLIGELEMRYDAAKKRCIYEPVSIMPRVLVPKVIREDNRYRHTQNEEGNPNARNA